MPGRQTIATDGNTAGAVRNGVAPDTTVTVILLTEISHTPRTTDGFWMAQPLADLRIRSSQPALTQPRNRMCTQTTTVTGAPG